MAYIFYNGLIICEEIGTNGIVIVIENLRWIDLIEIGETNLNYWFINF